MLFSGVGVEKSMGDPKGDPNEILVLGGVSVAVDVVAPAAMSAAMSAALCRMLAFEGRPGLLFGRSLDAGIPSWHLFLL